jgi:hypothetical protein
MYYQISEAEINNLKKMKLSTFKKPNLSEVLLTFLLLTGLTENTLAQEEISECVTSYVCRVLNVRRCNKEGGCVVVERDRRDKNPFVRTDNDENLGLLPEDILINYPFVDSIRFELEPKVTGTCSQKQKDELMNYMSCVRGRLQEVIRSCDPDKLVPLTTYVP